MPTVKPKVQDRVEEKTEGQKVVEQDKIPQLDINDPKFANKTYEEMKTL